MQQVLTLPYSNYSAGLSQINTLSSTAEAMIGNLTPYAIKPALILTPEYPELATALSMVQHTPSSWHHNAPGLELTFNPELPIEQLIEMISSVQPNNSLARSDLSLWLMLINDELTKLQTEFQPRIQIVARNHSAQRIQQLASTLSELGEHPAPLSPATKALLLRKKNKPRPSSSREQLVLEVVLLNHQGQELHIIDTHSFGDTPNTQWISQRYWKKSLIDSRARGLRLDYQFLQSWFNDPTGVKPDEETTLSTLSELHPDVLSRIVLILQRLNKNSGLMHYVARTDTELFPHHQPANGHINEPTAYTPNPERTEFVKFTSSFIRTTDHEDHLKQTHFLTAISSPTKDSSAFYDNYGNSLQISLFFHPFPSEQLPELAAMDAVRSGIVDVEHRSGLAGLMKLGLAYSLVKLSATEDSVFPGRTPEGRQTPAKKNGSKNPAAKGKVGEKSQKTNNGRSGSQRQGQPRTSRGGNSGGTCGGNGGGDEDPKKPRNTRKKPFSLSSDLDSDSEDDSRTKTTKIKSRYKPDPVDTSELAEEDAALSKQARLIKQDRLMAAQNMKDSEELLQATTAFSEAHGQWVEVSTQELEERIETSLDAGLPALNTLQL